MMDGEALQGRFASPRVVLVDANAILRRGLRLLLESHGIEVCAEVSDAREAVECVETVAPNLVLMDVTAGGEHWLGAIRAIVTGDSRPRVLAVTPSPDHDAVLDALDAGAFGCLSKSAEAGEVVAAVRAVAAGEVVICSAIAARLLPYLSRCRAADRRPRGSERLTFREREILRLITEGRENPDIARELFISPYTVKNHVANILTKLGTENRVKAAVMAAGWV